ncbi:caspase domain-containing protein [Myxococcota bacterium]
MNRAVVLVAALTLIPSMGWSRSSVRYALVVGNNHGATPRMALDDLAHAEQEAHRLHQQLLDFGNFTPERALLLTGATRQEILRAAGKLAAQRARDRQELGSLPTLFAFFFTGHGLADQLLTEAEPLSGGDVGRIFHDIDAELSVGFFDACYSGSLDFDALKSKGAVATPGFNPISALPDEILNSEGTLWFVSSRPNELSYEDQQLGGLFTHFFIESFTDAEPDGIGITLENMWEYARSRTQTHTARYGRTQTPEKVVRRLKTRGPLYFSFPHQRSALLQFHPEVAGTFLIRHEHGTLVEKVTKQHGRPLTVPTYPGVVVLSRIDGAQRTTGKRFELAAGVPVTVRLEHDLGNDRPGYVSVPIRSKGSLSGLQVTEADYGLGWLVGARYTCRIASHKLVGTPHAVGVASWMLYGPFGLGLDVGFARGERKFESWSMTQSEIIPGMTMALAAELPPIRIQAEVSGRLVFSQVEYDNGDDKSPMGWWAGGGGRVQIPIPSQNPWVVIGPHVHLGISSAEGVAHNDEKAYRSLGLSFGVDVMLSL